MNDTQQPVAYEGWAIVELMGHRRLAGYVREAAQFGTAMIRIDIPAEREGEQPITQFYGGSSIYCLSPVSEETARAVAQYQRPKPVHQYELIPPTRPALSTDHDPFAHKDLSDEYDE